MTAAHCVNSQGKWALNWVFEPGYRYGPGSDGTWAATPGGYVVPSGHLTTTDGQYDIGFVMLSRDSAGRRIQDVVGAQGITWNLPTSLQVFIFGYPAVWPYTGESLQYCPTNTWSVVAGHMLANCDLPAGASGGPWLAYFDGTNG